jgi:taurine dioxygenase/putative 2-oxoglutarate oxygenase
MALRIRPLDAPFGAEIIGVDFSAHRRQHCRGDRGRVGTLQHPPVPQRAMTPAQHVAFTRRLGPLHIREPVEFNLPGFPEVLVVSNVEKDNKADRHETRRMGDGIRTAEDKALPNAGSFIHALLLPPADGRYAVCRHLCSIRGAARRCAAQDHGPRACFSRARFHEVYYPTSRR